MEHNRNKVELAGGKFKRMTRMGLRPGIAAIAFAFTFLSGQLSAQPTPLPEHVDTFLVTYCLDCHDKQSEKGGINLDFLEIDWADPHAPALWGKAWNMIESGDMPPEDKKQPSDDEVLAVIDWLGEALLEHDKPGGTILRRLSKDEYERSVSALLKLPFSVPITVL